MSKKHIQHIRASDKFWAKARHDAKKAGKKLNAALLAKRVEVLSQIACPQRVSHKRLEKQDSFFSGIKRKYGLDRSAYLRILQSQDSCCAICSTELVLFSSDATERPVVDHCHKTGTVRGILCHTCNVRVGRAEFRADSKSYAAAKAYLGISDLTSSKSTGE